MKKIYVMMAAALVCASAGAKTVEVNFDGTDNEGWNASGNQTVSNGHFYVPMSEQANGKYRQDMRYDAPSDAEALALNPETDKYIAVKFIGSRPNGNMSLEFRFQDKVTCSGGNFNNKPHGTTVTKAGNQVCYWELGRNANYGTQTTNDLLFLQFKIADCVEAPYEYTIDWIKVYPSLEAMEADKNRADDGEGDMDEAVVVNMPVVNETTQTGYTALAEAWDQARSGDVITVNEDQTISGGRLSANGREITIQGSSSDVRILRGENYTNGLMFLTNAGDVEIDGVTERRNGNITLRNLTLDGQDVAVTSNFVEASGNGTLNLENVHMTNCTTSHNQGIVSMKNGGRVNAANVTMSNVNVMEGCGVIFCGTDKLTVSGYTNVSVFCQMALTFNAAEMSEGAVVNIFVDAARDMAEAALIVKGENLSTDNFNSAVNNYNLRVADNGIEFVYEEGYTSGVEGVAAEVEAAPVEYYNLQGVRVAEPSNGLFIRRQGQKVEKVIVK